MSDILDMIKEINQVENINIEKEIIKFEKKLKKCFKLYENNYGFEDFRMNEIDYIILYTIWKSISEIGNLESYLIIIYSYYKLEDFYFPSKKFKCDGICDIIKKTEIIKMINNFIYIS